MPSSRSRFPQEVPYYSGFLSDPLRKHGSVLLETIRDNHQAPYRLEYFPRTGEVVLVTARAPQRFGDRTGVRPAELLARVHTAQTINRWISEHVKHETEWALSEVRSYFRRLASERAKGRYYEWERAPRVKLAELDFANRYRSRVNRTGAEVREIATSLYARPFPGVEWRLMTTDDGEIWAETVEGQDNAVVRKIASRGLGPVESNLREVLSGIETWQAEPDGVDWVIGQLGDGRLDPNPSGAEFAWTTQSYVEDKVDDGQRLEIVGQQFNLGNGQQMHFSYNPSNGELVAIQYAQGPAWMIEYPRQSLQVVTTISQQQADFLSKIPFDRESGFEGLERVLNAAMQLQIGMLRIDGPKLAPSLT